MYACPSCSGAQFTLCAYGEGTPTWCGMWCGGIYAPHCKARGRPRSPHYPQWIEYVQQEQSRRTGRCVALQRHMSAARVHAPRPQLARADARTNETHLSAGATCCKIPRPYPRRSGSCLSSNLMSSSPTIILCSILIFLEEKKGKNN